MFNDSDHKIPTPLTVEEIEKFFNAIQYQLEDARISLDAAKRGDPSLWYVLECFNVIAELADAALAGKTIKDIK